MVRQICLLLIIAALSLGACGSSKEGSPEPQTEQAMLQATIDALQATVDASDAVGRLVDEVTTKVTAASPTVTAVTPPPTPTMQVVQSFADQLIGDWRVYDTYQDGCISRRGGQWKSCGYDDGTIGFLKGFVLSPNGRFLDLNMEEFGTYQFDEQQRQFHLIYPSWTETYRIVEISPGTMTLVFENETMDQAVEFARYGASLGAGSDVSGLWYFEPNEFSDYTPRIFLGNDGRFFAWFVNESGWPVEAFGGKYEPFINDVWLLPGASWEDSINGPPTLHIERIEESAGRFSFPEVETETGYNATRVREDQELMEKLLGKWLLDNDPEFELDFGSEETGELFGISGQYIIRAFEDNTIGLFATERGYGFVLCRVTLVDSQEVILSCPADGQSASEIRLNRKN